MQQKCDLEISPEAKAFIEEELKKHAHPEDFSIVIADTHAIGSMYDIRVHPTKDIVDIGHYDLLFPAEYHNNGLAIYADRTLLWGNYLPEHMQLVVWTRTSGARQLDIKNADFE
jgi:hypothetical protein